jgi:chemotaxis protein CheD
MTETAAETEMELRFLPVGDFYFGGDALRIQTVLGTCVSITMWHPIRRLGGMCHYLLPERTSTSAAGEGMRGVYATEAIALFADSLRRAGAKPRDFVVKMFGGGNMFPEQLRDPDCRKQTCSDTKRLACDSIGCRNIVAGRRLLTQEGYSVGEGDVGGHGSRQVLFDVWSGDVWVRQGHALGQMETQ